jgi:hypothetical protein
MNRQFTITIESPCTEAWSGMSSTSMGAFCAACSKEVIDFTGMDDDQLVRYFTQQKQQPECGRFRTEQLKTYTITINPEVFRLHIPVWKKMLVVILVCFGTMIFNNATAQLVNVGTHTQITASDHSTKKIFKKKKRSRNKKGTLHYFSPDIYIPIDMGIIGYTPKPNCEQGMMEVPNFPIPQKPVEPGKDSLSESANHAGTDNDPLPANQSETPFPLPELFKNERYISLAELRRK